MDNVDTVQTSKLEELVAVAEADDSWEAQGADDKLSDMARQLAREVLAQREQLATQHDEILERQVLVQDGRDAIRGLNEQLRQAREALEAAMPSMEPAIEGKSWCYACEEWTPPHDEDCRGFGIANALEAMKRGSDG